MKKRSSTQRSPTSFTASENPRNWKDLFALVGICLGLLVGSMSWSVVNTSLPAIQKALGASLLQLQWMMSVFGMAIVSALVLMGRLADVYGKKRFYALGLVSLSISVLGSALSPSPGWIIFFLTFSGLAGAILLPVSQALLCTVFDEKERGKAMGIWASASGIGLAIGPLISGIVLDLLDWRWVFFIICIIAVTSLAFVILFVKEAEKIEDETIDWIGALLLAGTIVTFVLAINQSQTWPHTVTIGIFFLCALFLTFLFWYEKKPKFPILREDLLKNRTFLLASVAIYSLIFFVWASFFLLPLFFQNVQKFSPLKTGLTMLFVTIPLAAISPYVGKLSDRVGPRKLMMAGSLCLLVCLAIEFLTFDASTPYIYMVLATLFFGFGWALLWGPSTTMAIARLPKKYMGISSGTFVTFQEIGGTMGLALTVTVVRMEGDFLKGLKGGLVVLAITTLAGLIASWRIKPILEN